MKQLKKKRNTGETVLKRNKVSTKVLLLINVYFYMIIFQTVLSLLCKAAISVIRIKE